MLARSTPGLRLLLLALLAGCAARAATPEVPQTPRLLPSLQATTFGDSVRFVLQVTNTTEAPVLLEFRSGQRFDFVVERAGERVWRWADDRMFTQAVERESLPPGETLSFSASWLPPPGLSGEYSVRGILTAADHRVEQEARFRIP